MKLAIIRKTLRSKANPEKAVFLQRFFKAGKGEYAEGDKLLGVTVPEVRAIARKGRDLSLTDIRKLLSSCFHEERLLALLLLVQRFDKEPDERDTIYRFYLKNTKSINNWDLVDCSAHKIVGRYLEDRPKAILLRLAKSKMLWERRIAILSTFWFIQRGEFREALRVSGVLVKDEEDLIHKAVGWMLREIGKRDRKTEETFLKRHYRRMPRTMLRYAIEKFPESRRKAYLRGTVG